MTNAVLRQEVDRLRDFMTELARQALRTDAAVGRLAADVQELKERGLRSEAAVARLADEMREFKDEMRAFKQEMHTYKEESQRERRQMNRQWGDLANRLGTLVEDIVAPNLPRVAAELFGCRIPEFFAVRVVRHHGGETWEADALVVCPRLVLVNETKSRLLEGHIDGILEKLAGVPRVFPDYAGRRAIGVLASLYPEEGVVRRATRKGVLVMGMGDDTMDVLNPELLTAGAAPGFEPGAASAADPGD